MKPHQTLDCIKKGLLLTLFIDDENLLKNFGLFFGDSDLKIERKEHLEGDRYEYIITADTKPIFFQRYHRTFVVGVSKVDHTPRYEFQILTIDEC